MLFKNFITKSAPWVPWTDEHGDTWVWTQSTVDDNPFVDGENYKLQLAASVGGDVALARAWTLGEWGALGGNMWDNFNPAVHVISGLPYLPGKPTWRLGCDWGTAAPFVALLGVEVPADVPGYTPGSIIVVDEVDSVASPDNLNVGTGMAPDAAADYIIQMCNKHGVEHKTGAIDDAKGLQGESVISLMQGRYLYLHKPFKKDRAGGWLTIRQRLSSSVSGDGPGLYIHARCVNLIECLANAPRDVRRVEDVDHRYPDHHLDAARYLISEFTQGKVVFGRAVGMT